MLIPRFLALFNGLGFIVVEVKKKTKTKARFSPSWSSCKTDTSMKLIITNNFFIPFIRGAM